MSLAQRVLDGDLRSAARLMRDIDDRFPSAVQELKALYPHTGNAYVLGLTGPPGAGKSTLVDRIIEAYRKKGLLVGVVAIDPTSPFTGGAILGDRIRMNRHAEDSGVFIRSLATRGCLGGLSRSTMDVVNVMDAMGMDVIIVETVGVGQDEVDIVSTAHTTAVVMVPGLGDDIQAIKAGILEIGDVFIVNKGDREGADRTVRELSAMLEMKDLPSDAWVPPVLKTEGARGVGIDELVVQLDAHRSYLKSSGKLSRLNEERNTKIFTDTLRDELFSAALEAIKRDGRYGEIIEGMRNRSKDPYTAVEEILERHAFS